MKLVLACFAAAAYAPAAHQLVMHWPPKRNRPREQPEHPCR